MLVAMYAEFSDHPMNDNHQCCEACGDEHRESKLRTLWNPVRRWLFLNVWLGHFYRPTMSLLHRFNLHYMPPMTRMIGQPEYENNHWCKWCGLRGTTANKKFYDEMWKDVWNRVDRTSL